MNNLKRKHITEINKTTKVTKKEQFKRFKRSTKKTNLHTQSLKRQKIKTSNAIIEGNGRERSRTELKCMRKCCCFFKVLLNFVLILYSNCTIKQIQMKDFFITF